MRNPALEEGATATQTKKQVAWKNGAVPSFLHSFTGSFHGYLLRISVVPDAVLGTRLGTVTPLVEFII